MTLLIGPALVCAAVALNIPFGAYRATVATFSVRWFLAIHLPIPFIFLLRVGAGYGYSFIPWLFAGAVGGQLAGRASGGGGASAAPARPHSARPTLPRPPTRLGGRYRGSRGRARPAAPPAPRRLW